MREITQTKEYDVRGQKLISKIENIINHGNAEAILLEDGFGEVLFRISPDKDFLSQTLEIVKGIIKAVRSYRLVVSDKQTVLFN